MFSMASGSLRAGAGKSPRTNSAELYDFVMSEGVGYPDLVRAWSKTCGRAVDWLAGVGVGLEETAPGRIWLDQKSEISLAPVYKKDVGTRAVATLKARFERLGGRYMNSIEGVSLIRENGAVHGIIGKQNGETLELRAGDDLIHRRLQRERGTGSGAISDQLMPTGVKLARLTKQDTGDGLRMALEAGATAVNLQYFYGHLIARKALVDDRFWPYPRLDSFVDEGILIDRHGRRFVDEGRGDVAVANELARSDDPTGATLIFDHESWEASKHSPSSTSLTKPAPNPWL